MTQVIKDVVQWLQQWFYTEDEIDAMLSDLPTGGGITSITLVPYSQNPNGVICYDGGVAPVVIDVDSVSLVSNKSILSAYDSESTTLTATVLDSNEDGVEGVEVSFIKNGVSIGTAITNANGVATKTYSANGDGDITFSASCTGVSSESINVEDCIYWNENETSVTRSGTTIYGYWNADRFSNLPPKYFVEFDMKTTSAPSSNSEQRIFWCPTSQWGGTGSQPSNALFVGYAYASGMKFNYGKRLSGQTSSLQNISATTNNWDTVKIQKVDSARCDFYFNGTYRDYYSFTNMESYSEFALTYIMWSNTTFSIRNIKIKKVI